MPRTRAKRRYLIEIRDAEGSVVFAATTSWDDKDKRLALAQIGRLAQLPEVNFYTGPAHEPDSGTSRSDRRFRARPLPNKKPCTYVRPFIRGKGNEAPRVERLVLLKLGEQRQNQGRLIG
jgi:hypothetical protein